MKLSIIVPVYNVEKYIVKCISSLLDQQTNDYEIIIVNDGTKDKSIDLIKKTFNDSKIAIIEQENQGLSAARNTGVRHSKGEYIWFVDSDDWIAKGGIDELIPILDGHTELVYQSKVYQIIENKKQLIVRNDFDGELNGVQFMAFKMPLCCAPYYIILRSFWKKNNFMFYEGILHEDNEIMPKVVYIASKMKCIHIPLYNYSIRSESITHSYNPKRFKSLEIVCNSLFVYLKSHVRKEHAWAFSQSIIPMIYFLLESVHNGNKKEQEEVNNFFSAEKGYMSLLMEYGNWKAKIFSFMVILRQGHAVDIYRFLRKISK